MLSTCRSPASLLSSFGSGCSSRLRNENESGIQSRIRGERERESGTAASAPAHASSRSHLRKSDDPREARCARIDTSFPGFRAEMGCALLPPRHCVTLFSLPQPTTDRTGLDFNHRDTRPRVSDPSWTATVPFQSPDYIQSLLTYNTTIRVQNQDTHSGDRETRDLLLNDSE